MRYCWSLLFLLCPLLAHAGGHSGVFDPLSDWQKQGVAVTAMAYDLTTKQPLAELNADKRLVPASLSKLFVAAAALGHWGSDKTFRTRLMTNGHIKGGTLKGDLALLGGGDPGLVSERLWSLIGQLQLRGVKQVAGDLLVDTALFGKQTCATSDRCQARSHSRNAYNAGLSAAGVNYGSWCVKVLPASAVGQPATVTTCPFNFASVDVDAKVETVTKGRKLHLRRVTDPKDHRDRLVVSGQIGVQQAPTELYVSAGNASRQAGVILKSQLALAGITLSGRVRVVNDGDYRTLLASRQSLPLATLVKHTLNYSNNYMADVLTLDLLAEAYPGKDVTPAAAGKHLLEQVKQQLAPATLKESKVAARLANGSGLSIKNRLSAADLVTLLHGVYDDPAIFPAFVGGLTVPAYSVLGILRGPNALWQRRVMAKSGSLNEPHTVYGVAGFARGLNNHWIAFAVLVNGTDKHPHMPYSKSMRYLRAAVVAVIEAATSQSGDDSTTHQ